MTTPVSSSVLDRFSALDAEQRIRLMRRLVEAGRVDQVPAVVPLRDGDGPVPLSPAQEDLWVFEMLHPRTAALHLCIAYHFDAPVEPEQLSAALTMVQDNNDVLRVRVSGDTTDPGSLRMDFPPTGPFPLERLDLRACGRTQEEVFTSFRDRTFDIAGGERLIRGLFVTVDDERAVLLLSLHHMITDWWSFDVLHTQFADAYRAVTAGGAPLRRSAVQYADFASWQRELKAAGVLDARLGFWESYLADPPAPLLVPGARAATEEFGIAQVPFAMDAETARAVRELAHSRGTTVYTVLMAVVAAFTAHLTGASDLVLGTPVANRSAKGVQQVIGYVMNLAPTRWRVGPADSLATLIDRFAGELPDLLAHAVVPVGSIVERTSPVRTAGKSPLFRWLFIYTPQQESARRLREFTLPERVHTGGEHDLVAIVQDSDDGFRGFFEVRTDVYDPADVRHWADGFTALLPTLVSQPETPVASYDLLTAGRRQHLLSGVGEGAECASLPELLRRQAERTPDAPALDADGETLTYAQLVDRVAHLAGALEARGAGPGTTVAVAFGRGAAATTAALAVQHTGAAHLPLDPAGPVHRLRHMLDDAHPVLLVTEPDAPTPYAPTGLPVLELDESAIAAAPAPPRVPAPQQAAYLLYTSGTTGRPKGVVVPHAGLAGLAGHLAGLYRLAPGSRVLQIASPAFDMSVAETAMVFRSGATLVAAPPGPWAGEELGRLIGEKRITDVFVPPALFEGVSPDQCPDLRTVGLSGEACGAALVSRWLAAGRTVLNLYGPTETTVIATDTRLTDEDALPSIGGPFPGTRAYVLDPVLRALPVGVQGELYVAGDGLARGYQGKPALTAERFLADPYGGPGTRMYRTGDLARVRPDGGLDFLGRADDQLKLNGLRVEPGEIEAVLSEHPLLRQAVVALREDTPGERRLVAYVVPRPGHRVDPKELRAHAASRLLTGMVPVTYVELATLPLTWNGKIDRGALPVPTAGPARPDAGPPTPREAVLRDLFARLVKRKQVSVDDDFFESGGDSVMAIRLVGLGREAGLLFTPVDVFEARTPAALASLARPVGADEEATTGHAPGRLPLTRVRRTTPPA
ncbi:non-ribosomal peptide synthetase [Streptomyces sp. NPDC003631]